MPTPVGDARVRAEQIDPAVRALGAAHQLGDGRGVGDVGRVGRRADRLRHGVRRRAVPVGDDDRGGTVGGEAPGQGGPDATAGTGHHDDGVLDLHANLRRTSIGSAASSGVGQHGQHGRLDAGRGVVVHLVAARLGRAVHDECGPPRRPARRRPLRPDRARPAFVHLAAALRPGPASRGTRRRPARSGRRRSGPGRRCGRTRRRRSGRRTPEPPRRRRDCRSPRRSEARRSRPASSGSPRRLRARPGAALRTQRREQHGRRGRGRSRA